MKMKTLTTLLAAIAMLGFSGCAEESAKSGGASAAKSGGGDPVELVLGTDKTSSPIFAMGNGLATAVALSSDSVSVFNYSTKGTKDNLKRITKKKRAINLAAVMLRGLEKSKLRKKVMGLAMLGSTRKNPDWVALVVRPKPPKGVSKARYNAAIANLVKTLYSKSTRKLMKKHWKRWAPNRATVVFKSVGVEIHPAALKVYKELGLR